MSKTINQLSLANHKGYTDLEGEDELEGCGKSVALPVEKEDEGM